MQKEEMKLSYVNETMSVLLQKKLYGRINGGIKSSLTTLNSAVVQ